MVDLPGGSDGKASAYTAGDLGSIPGLGRWEKEMATHSSTLAWKIPWTEEVGYSPWGCKESDTTEQLHFFTSNYGGGNEDNSNLLL